MYGQSDTSICSEVAAGGEVPQNLSVTASITVQNAGDTIEGNCADVTVLYETIRPTSPVSTEGMMEQGTGQEEEGNNEHINQAEDSDLDLDRNVSPVPAVRSGSDDGFDFATKVVSEDYIDDFVESPSPCAGLSSEENINGKESVCVIADDDTDESKPDVVDDVNGNDIIEKYEDVEEINTAKDKEEELDVSGNIEEKEDIDANKKDRFNAEISDKVNDKIDNFSVGEECHASPVAKVGVDNKEERIDGSNEDDKVKTDGGYHHHNMDEDYTDNSEEDNVVAVNIEQDVGLSEVEDETEKDEDPKSVRDDIRSNKDDHVSDDGSDAVKDKADSETTNDDMPVNKEDGINDDDNVADDEDSDANANKEDANDGSHSTDRQSNSRARGRLLRRSSPNSRPTVVDYGVPDETSGEFFEDEDLEFVMALEPDHFQEVNAMPLRAEFVAQSPPPAVTTAAPFNPASQSRSSPTVASQPERGPIGSSSEHISPTIANITHSVTPASDVDAPVDENEEATPVQLDSHEALPFTSDGLEIMNSQDACIVDADPTGLKWPATQPEPTAGNTSSSPVIASPNAISEPVKITSANSLPSSHQDLPNDDRIPSIIKRAACVPEVTLTNNEIPSDGDPNETKTPSPPKKDCVQSEEVLEDSEALASAENDFKNIESLDEAEPIIDQRERTDQDADLLLDQVINGKTDKSMGPNNTGRALGPMSGLTDFEDADMEESALANDSQEQNSTQATEDTEEQCLCKKRLSSSSFVISGESFLADVSKEGSTSSLIGGTDNNIDEDLDESIAKKVSPCVSNHNDMDELNDRWNTDEEVSVDDRDKDSSSHALQNMSQVNANENLNKDCSEVHSFLPKHIIATDEPPLGQHEYIEKYANGNTEIETIGETENNYAECKDVSQSLHDLYDIDNDDFFGGDDDVNNDERNRVECDDVNTGFDTDAGAYDPDSCKVPGTEEIKQTVSSSSSYDNVKEAALNDSCNEQKEQLQLPSPYDNDNILDNDDGELDVANHESSTKLDQLKENATFDGLQPEDNPLVQEMDEVETEPDDLNVGSLSRTSFRSDKSFVLGAVETPNRSGSGLQNVSLSNENLTDLRPQGDALTSAGDQGIDEFDSNECPKHKTQNISNETETNSTPENKEEDLDCGKEEASTASSDENVTRSGHENEAEITNVESEGQSEVIDVVEKAQEIKDPFHETISPNEEDTEQLEAESNTGLAIFKTKNEDRCANDETLKMYPQDDGQETRPLQEDIQEKNDLLSIPQNMSSPGSDEISKEPKEEVSERGEALSEIGNENKQLCREEESFAQLNCDQAKLAPSSEALSKLDDECVEINRYLVELNCETLAIPESSEKQKNVDNFVSNDGVNYFDDASNKTMRNGDDKNTEINHCFGITQVDNQTCAENATELNNENAEMSKSDERLLNINPDAVDMNGSEKELTKVNSNTSLESRSSEGLEESKSERVENAVNIDTENKILETDNHVESDSDEGPTGINNENNKDLITCGDPTLQFGGGNLTTTTIDENLPTMVGIQPTATTVDAESLKHLIEVDNIVCVNPTEKDTDHLCQIAMSNCCTYSPELGDMEKNERYVLTDDRVQSSPENKESQNRFKVSSPSQINDNYVQEDKELNVDGDRSDDDEDKVRKDNLLAEQEDEFSPWETDEDRISDVDSELGADVEEMDDDETYDYDDGARECITKANEIGEGKETIMDSNNDESVDKAGDFKSEENVPDLEVSLENRAEIMNVDGKEAIMDSNNDENVDEGGDFEPEENVPDFEISLENQAEKLNVDGKKTIIDSNNYESVDEGGDFEPEENVPGLEISLENQAEKLNVDGKEIVMDSKNDESVDEGGDFEPEENVPDLEVSLENQAEINGDGLTRSHKEMSRMDDIEQEDLNEKKTIQLVEDEMELMDGEEISSSDDKSQKLLVVDQDVMEEDVIEEDQECAPDKCPSDTESGHDDLQNVSLTEEMSEEKKIETGDEVESVGIFQSFDKPQEIPTCLDEELNDAVSESVCDNSVGQIKLGENIPEHANIERGNSCDESDTNPSHVIDDNVTEDSTCTTIDDLSLKQEGQEMRSPEPTPPDTNVTFNIEKEAGNVPETHSTGENRIDGAETVFPNKEDNAEDLCDIQQSDSCFAVGEINKDLFMIEVDPSLQVASTNTTVFVAEKQQVDTVMDEFDPEHQATPFEQSGAPLRQQLSPASKVILDNTDVWLNKISDFCKSPALALDEPNKDLQLQNLAAQCKSEIVSLSRCQDVCANSEPNESTSLNDTPDDLPRSTTPRRRLKRVSNASSQHSVLGDEYVPRPPDSARSSRPQSSRSNASSRSSIRHKPGASYSISEKGSIGHNTPEEIDSHPSLASNLSADNKPAPEMLKQNNVSVTKDRPIKVQNSQSIQNSDSSRELNLKTSGEETLDDISTCPSLAGSSFHIASYARANSNAREEQAAAPSTQPQHDTVDQLRSKSVEGPSIVPDNAPRGITERRRCGFKATATLPKILRQNDPRNGSQVFQPHPPNTMNSTQTDSRPSGRSRLALRSRLLRVGTVSPEAKGDGSPKKVDATSKFDKVLGPRKKTERKSLSPARTSVDAGQRRLRAIPTGDSVPGVSHLSRQKMEPLKLPGQKKPPKPKINKMMTMAEFERAQADKHLNQAFARVNSSKPYVDCHMDAKIMEKTGGSVKSRRERVNYNSLIAVENIKFLEVLQYKRSSYARDEQLKNFQKTFKSMVHLGK